ncbi:MAG: helix-turn-helix domain-containing protein, partial [Stackebrandtia sp.]
VFLEHRRSWQATAAVLHVHRQTVRYRIRKVEEITGRTTSETSDVAQFWLALQTRRQLAGHS